MYYMKDVREMLREQVWLASVPNDVMFWPKDVVGRTGRGGACNETYV